MNINYSRTNTTKINLIQWSLFNDSLSDDVSLTFGIFTFTYMLAQCSSCCSLIRQKNMKTNLTNWM